MAVTLVLCGIMSVIVFLEVREWHTSSQSLFRAALVSPIPESVTDIRVDRVGGFFVDSVVNPSCHTYIMRFNISVKDFSRVLAASAFSTLGWVEYESGSLHFGMTRNVGGSIELYGTRWNREPGWFDLGQWKGYEAYIMEQEVPTSWYKVRVLVYDRLATRACLIEHEVTGSWGGILSVTDPCSQEIPEWVRQRIEQGNTEGEVEGVRGGG
ncbi:MAG: hypothetical protein KBE65_06835 [Phycisphaerae bacterium]|nr:hypothetical protein [Phycisphaerae bacterium]